MLICLFQAIGYFSSSKLIYRMGRKTLIISTLAIQMNIGLILTIITFIVNLSESPKSTIIIIIELSLYLANVLLVCIQFGVIYPYATELFTTKNRSIAIGIMLTVSKICNGFSTYDILFLQRFSLNPSIFYFVFGLIALPCAMYLPETKNNKIKN